MTTQSVSRANAQLQKAARGVVMMLAIEFLLGMAVNFIGLPDEATGSVKVVTGILLGLHILVGIGLLVSAIMATRASRSFDGSLRNLVRFGGAGIGITFVFGVLTVATGSDWWSYLMGVGFIGSLLIYGKILLRVRTNVA
jgi:hypothetical protein